jgi:hypothetical protein
MTTPLHPLVSTPLSAPPSVVRARLVGGLDDLVAAATADAIATLAPQARAWGLTPSALPTVHTRPTNHDELGSAEVTWAGDEDATGWPAVSGRLLVDLAPAGGSRLVFLAHRSPWSELRTSRLDRLHRQRLTGVAVRRALRQLALALGEGAAARPSPVAIPGLDRTPRFTHALRSVDADVLDLAPRMAAAPADLAQRATAEAVARTRATWATGCFRAPAAPDVAARTTGLGELGVLRIGWRSDEEATGWPQLSWTVVLEPGAAGTRLAVLSAREPGYDLSVNRFDKQARDGLLRQAGGHVADALVAALQETVSTTARGRDQLVASGASSTAPPSATSDPTTKQHPTTERSA